MENTNPKVSIIIPTYNRHSLIRETIESVLNQTYTHYDLIVVDDASTDKTAEWIAKAYPNLQLVRLSKNQGSAGARNVAIELATGEFIAFLDHDDEWQPTYLETQVKTLQENPQAVLSYCNYSAIEANGAKFDFDLKPWRIYPNPTHHLLMENVIHSMSLVLIRRQALLQAGLLNTSLKICNDRELYLRLFYLGGMMHIPENLVIKNLHDRNLIRNYRLWAKEALMLLNIFFADPRSKPYKHLAAQAKSHWCMKLEKLVWDSPNRDIFFRIEMVLKAFLFNPKLRTYTLLKWLKKIIGAEIRRIRSASL